MCSSASTGGVYRNPAHGVPSSILAAAAQVVLGRMDSGEGEKDAVFLERRSPNTLSPHSAAAFSHPSRPTALATQSKGPFTNTTVIDESLARETTAPPVAEKAPAPTYRLLQEDSFDSSL